MSSESLTKESERNFSDAVSILLAQKKTNQGWKDVIRGAVTCRKNAKKMLEEARKIKLRTLASFLPTMVLQDLTELPYDALNMMQPYCRRLDGAVVVMFDLCSFTKLAEDLRKGSIFLNDGSTNLETISSVRTQSIESKMSPTIKESISRSMLSAHILRLQSNEDAQAGYGAEQLKDLLKTFFQELMGTLTKYGGDVMRLAGDALIVIFHDRNGDNDGDSSSLLQRAALVSMLALRRLEGTLVRGLELHLHVALGVGPVDLYILGDKRLGWQYVAAGDGFQSLGSALDDGSAGQMVVNSDMWNKMKNYKPQDEYEENYNAMRLCCNWDSIELPSNNFILSLNATKSDIEKALQYDLSVEKEKGNDYAGAAKQATELLLSREDSLERVVRLFSLPPITYACEAESSGWFAELHRVAVIFLNISLDKRPNLAIMQRVSSILQGTVNTFQGVIKELSQDDKGIVMVGVMGLPPHAGADPALRACLASMRMSNLLSKMGVNTYIGISMGNVFTASIGSSRREFGIFGDVVNTAARLMSAGKKNLELQLAIKEVSMSRKKSSITPRSARRVKSENGSEELKEVIIAEESVQVNAATFIQFHFGGKIKVKGKADKISVWLPIRKKKQDALSNEKLGDTFPFVGHRHLRHKLETRISLLTQGMGGGLLILQGEFGMGKSRLLSMCAPEWEKHRVAICGTKPFPFLPNFFSARSIQGGTEELDSFGPWRSILCDLILLLKPKVMASAGCRQYLKHSLSVYVKKGFSIPYKSSKNKKQSLSPSITQRSSLPANFLKIVEPKKSEEQSDTSSIRSSRSHPTKGMIYSPVRNEFSPVRPKQRRRHSLSDGGKALKKKLLHVTDHIHTKIKMIHGLKNTSNHSKTNCDSSIASSKYEDANEFSDLPSWAGAFGGTEDEEDFPDNDKTRGEYLLKFCEEFMPNDVNRSTHILCSLFAAECPINLEKDRFALIKSDEIDITQSEEIEVISGVITAAALADNSLPLLFLMDANHPLSNQSVALIMETIEDLSRRVLMILTSPPLPWLEPINENQHLPPSMLSQRDSMKMIRQIDQENINLDAFILEGEIAEFESDIESSSEDEGFSNDDNSDVDGNTHSNDCGFDMGEENEFDDQVFMTANSQVFMTAKCDSMARVFKSSGEHISFTHRNEVCYPPVKPLLLTMKNLSRKEEGSCQALSIGPLGFKQCAEMARSLLGGFTLSSIASLAIFLRTQGKPLYTIEYCSFAIEKELGMVVTSNSDPKPSLYSSASYASASDISDESDDERKKVDEKIEGDIPKWWILHPSKVSCRIFQEVVPSVVEQSVLQYLNCLTMQQIFVLKVLSAIGNFDISISILEAIYPLKVDPNRSLAMDVLELEACKILSVRLDRGKYLLASFRDLVLHQVMYRKLSFEHRRVLHKELANIYRTHMISKDLSCEFAHEDCLPMYIHHLNLAQMESKAVTMLHIFGVHEVEHWAFSYFKRFMKACLPFVPPEVEYLAMTYRDILWLVLPLKGLIKTLTAIKSGQVVSLVAEKFKKYVQDFRIKKANNMLYEQGQS